MRYFRHTIAEYVCEKRCGYQHPVVGANLSPFHVLAAMTAIVAAWAFSIYKHFPWYYFISIPPGELLLLFCAGILVSLVAVPFQSISRCKQCGAPMMRAGQHVDPAGSAKPHWTDIALFIIFIGLNILVWIKLTKGDL